MIQEDKDLLLKDLCARVPYEVKVDVHGATCLLNTVNFYEEVGVDDGTTTLYDIAEIKPYLFPLSSMTEEQYEILLSFNTVITTKGVKGTIEGFEYLYENHFDIRGLISKGLAIDGTSLNIY